MPAYLHIDEYPALFVFPYDAVDPYIGWTDVRNQLGITVALFDKDDLTMYDQWYNAAGFVVESKLIGDTRWHLMQEEHGVVYLPPDWKYSSERLP